MMDTPFTRCCSFASLLLAGSKEIRMKGQNEQVWSRALLGLVLSACLPTLVAAQSTVLSEGFEGAFPGSWVVGDADSRGTVAAYWKDVNSSFGGEGVHSGTWKGYCAGTGFAGTTGSPQYREYMWAYMDRQIDLRGYSSATLTFWHKMPSLETCCDLGRVVIDYTNVVRTVDTAGGGWTQVTVNLNAWVGAERTLSFEFLSDYSIQQEGWYLDDILLTGTQIGSVVATLRNQNGVTAPANGSTTPCFILYTTPSCGFSSSRPAACGFNPATFSSVPTGTYAIEGYQTGTFWGQEFWQSQCVTVASGNPTATTLTRKYPYAPAVSLAANGSGVSPGQAIPVGSSVTAAVVVQNDVPTDLTVRVRFGLDRDRDQTLPYNFDFDMTSAPQTVTGGGGTRAFVFNHTATDVGQQYYSLQVETVVNSNWVRTDSYPWNQTFVVCAPPGNDGCANAPSISLGTTAFDTQCSSTDGPMPAICPPPGDGTTIGSDVWYNYTASANGTLTIDTCGSGFDTVLIVYSGTSCPVTDGRRLACSDDSNACGQNSRQSSVAIPVSSGGSYKIRVGGYNSLTGSGTLTLALTVSPATFGGTVTDCCTGSAVSGATVCWGPDCQLTTASGSYVFTGVPCESRILTVSKPGYRSASHTYEPVCNASNLEDVCLARGEDGCATATNVLAPGSYAFCTLGAGTSGPTPTNCGNGNTIGADVWFRYTPEASGTLVVDTCNSDFDTVLIVYGGGSCPPNNQVECNDDNGTCATHARVTVQVSAGSAYLLRVGGFEGETGSGSLRLSLATPPPITGTLQGQVFNQATNQGIGSATVALSGGPSALSGPSGDFAFTGLTAGSYSVSFGATGFESIVRQATVSADSTTHLSVGLVPVSPGVVPAVIDVSGALCGPGRRVLYLDGAPLTEMFTAQVNWNGLTPGSVQFMTPNGALPGFPVNGAWQRSFEMGTDFGVGGTLRVRAVAATGEQSAAYTVNMKVIEPPPGVVASDLVADNDAGSLVYRASRLLPDEIRVGTNRGGDEPFATVPPRIPFFAGHGVDFTVRFMIRPEVRGDGSGTGRAVALSGDVQFPRIGFADVSIGPSVRGGATWRFSESQSRWTTTGNFEVSVAASLETRQYQALVYGLPMVFQGTASANWGASLAITDCCALGATRFNGSVLLDPAGQVELAAGVGVANAVNARAFGGGGLRTRFQYPTLPTVQQFDLFAFFGVTVQIYFVELDYVLWEGALDLLDLAMRDATQAPRLVSVRANPRRHLRTPQSYARFMGQSGQGASPRTSATVESPLQLNVYPESSTAISSSGANVVVVWVYDDPARTPTNGTELVYSLFEESSGTWSMPAAVEDNGTADFNPRLATLPDGSVLAVWEDVKEVLSEPQDPDDPAQVLAKYEELKSKLEIASARFDAAARAWGPATHHSENLMIDHSPRISVAPNGTAMAAWISNPGNSTSGDATNPSTVWSADYSAGAWAPPIVVAGGLESIIRHDAACSENGAVFVYSADIDGDPTTAEDRELFQVTRAGGAWAVPVRATVNTVEDANPNVAWSQGASDWQFAWARSTEVFAGLGSVGSGVPVISIPQGSAGLADFALALGPNGQLAVVWQDPIAGNIDLQYAVNDPVTGRWSSPQSLTADERMEYAPSATFTAAGDLLVAYNKMSLTTEPRSYDLHGEQIEFQVPAAGTADLYALRHTIGGDLAVDVNVTIDPPNPPPGVAATIAATVRNLGDSPAEGVLVEFYSGNPIDGSNLIGSTVVQETLSGGESASTSIAWTAPQTEVPLEIYVIADPDLAHEDRDRSNNTVVLGGVMQPDLVVDSLVGIEAGPMSRLLLARIRNMGAVSASPTALTLHRDGAAGPILAVVSLPVSLAPGTYFDREWLWENTGKLPSGSIVAATIDEEGAITEFDESNNTLSALLLESVPPVVPCAGDANGDGVVEFSDITSVLENWARDYSPSTGPGDADRDGSVDFADITKVLENWGIVCP